MNILNKRIPTKEYVQIIESEEVGNDLRKKYLQHKMYGGPALLPNEKKHLKLYLEDNLNGFSHIVMGRIANNIKTLRSKNKARNSIDDLIELGNVMRDEVEDAHSRGQAKLESLITMNIKAYLNGHDVSEQHEKEIYKLRKRWGGVK